MNSTLTVLHFRRNERTGCPRCTVAAQEEIENYRLCGECGFDSENNDYSNDFIEEEENSDDSEQ